MIHARKPKCQRLIFGTVRSFRSTFAIAFHLDALNRSKDRFKKPKANKNIAKANRNPTNKPMNLEKNQIKGWENSQPLFMIQYGNNTKCQEKQTAEGHSLTLRTIHVNAA